MPAPVQEVEATWHRMCCTRWAILPPPGGYAN